VPFYWRIPATNTTTEGSSDGSSRDDDPLPPRTIIAVLALPLAALFSPFACDSATLLAMRGTTTGTVEAVGVRRGGRGTSAPKIEYTYTVDGRRHVSDRFAIGLFAKGTWSGGGRAAGDYHAGQKVIVHYDPRRPEDACLAYGWHPWSIGLPLFLVGLGLQGWGSRCGGKSGRIAQAVGWTLFPLGFAGLGLIRDVLRPSDLPLAAALAAVVVAANLLYRFAKGYQK
jgi:hypothetical protein